MSDMTYFDMWLLETIDQLPKICVRIGILMHKIFHFYFVGAFF